MKKISRIATGILSVCTAAVLLTGTAFADLNVQRIEKNEFNTASNSTIVFDGIRLSVPPSFSEEYTDMSTDDNKYYYAEMGEAVAFLETMYTDLPEAVSEDTFIAEKDDFDEGIISTLENPEILSSLDVTVAGYPGRILHVACEIEGMELEGYFTYFYKESEKRIDVLSFCQTTNTEYSYFSDYYKIVATAEAA